MKTATYRALMRSFGMAAVAAAVVLAGCQRGSSPHASAPAVNPPAMSAAHPVAAAATGEPASAGAIKVTVSLTPAMAAKAAPEDTVFIFARAAHGPHMPLAVVRKQVKDLPATIVLNDSLAMTPEMKLSSVAEAVVVARVSKTGDAIAQAGDLEGMAGPVKTGNGTVAVNIASMVTGK